MKSIKRISLAMTMLYCLLSLSQESNSKKLLKERIITGTVSDKNELLPFVTIEIKKTKINTQTDFDGKFSIKAKKGDKLVFSCLGYDNYEQEIGDKVSEYNIKLKSNAVLLEETYGYNPIKRKEKFPSTTIIAVEELKKPVAKNETLSLERKIPELNNSQEKATPLFIGKSNYQSKNFEEPLYLIDGIISTKKDIETINPDNIESVNVLKDKAAIAIYGQKAIGGAIIITSKKTSKKELLNLKEKQVKL